MRHTLRAAWLIFCPLFISPTLPARLLADETAEAKKAAQLNQWQATYEDKILPILRQRCVECHRGEDAQAGFDVAEFFTGKLVVKQMDLWDEVGKRIRLNEMPPEGSPQLDDTQKAAFQRWLDARPREDLCSQLATDETQAWYRGYVMSRRLTRTEYLNAVRDAVGVPVDPQLQIPSDGSGGEGFDTNGDTLFTSPIHIEQYLTAASQTIDKAVPENAPSGDDANSQQIRRARERLLAVMPSGDVSDTDAAKQTIAAFARRAWRRPTKDAEIERLLALYNDARRKDMSFVVAVRQALKAVLISPHFLFVVETESPAGGVQRLTPHQLAMRLSLFLWSSIPDDVLLREADAGRLDTKDQVIAQVRRMLDDPKARALGENFGLQWLGLANFLSSVRPDQEVFPEYDTQLAKDLREEAIRLVAGIFRDEGSLLDLIDADYVHVNGMLASHYGLGLPADAAWQRFETDNRRRGGVITLGAALMTASYPRRTSPVLRGRWVLEEILGGRVPPPPPSVPELDESETEKVMTLRERLEVHRENPECAACHNRMDPLGFGLENFDGLGRWRETDQGLPIDASGKLPSGQEFRGPEELKQILLSRAGEFERHFVRKMLGFALGRELNKFDDCVVDRCLERLAANDHRAGVILETIATSYPFQYRYFKAAENNSESE